MTLKLYRHQHKRSTNTDSLAEVRALGDAEAAQYIGACQHLHDFEQTRDLLALVSANLDEVCSEIERFAASATSEKRGALLQDRSGRRRLQRVVVNDLTAVRLYLDHRQTHLMRMYGPNSAPLVAFNDTRRRLHAAHPEYPFTYELRNFVQHCGMSLQALRAHQRIVVGQPERIEADVFVGCNRDELLSRFADWKHSRAFIESQPAEFAVLPILRQMAKCLQEVEAATINGLMPRLWRDGRIIAGILDEATDPTHIGLVAEVRANTEQPGATTISFKVPPFAILEWLQLIRQQPGPPGYEVVRPHLDADVLPQVT